MGVMSSLEAAITAAGGTPSGKVRFIDKLAELVSAWGGSPTKHTATGLLKEAITAVGGTPTQHSYIPLLRELATALGGTPAGYTPAALMETIAENASLFSPADLFVSAQVGGWYDPSDISTLWKDAAGTSAVTADGDGVARIDDKSGNGLHLVQATAANRPLYKVDSNGDPYLLFDGISDFLSVTFGGAVTQPLERISAIRQVSWTSNDRIFDNVTSTLAASLAQPSSGGGGVTPEISINSGAIVKTNGLAVGTSGVVTERHQGASSRIAVNNGAYVTGNAGTTVPTGLSIGARGDGAAPANVRVYGLVQRFGSVLTADEIASLRTWLGEKIALSL